MQRNSSTANVPGSNRSVSARFEIGSILVLLLTLLTSPLTHASEVDSEHLFGFTEGADIGKAGEREAESENIGHLGKAAGRYTALMQNDSVKTLLTDNLRFSANLMLAHFGISGVPGLPDRQLTALQGASFEARYMVLNRRNGPFGLTAIAEPRWSQIDANSGEKLTAYGGLFTLVADKELIDDCLLGTLNLLYDVQTTRLAVVDTWSGDSKRCPRGSRLPPSSAASCGTCVPMMDLASTCILAKRCSPARPSTCSSGTAWRCPARGISSSPAGARQVVRSI